ncbi:dTMP kinase, partial [Xanthomonas perforans]
DADSVLRQAHAIIVAALADRLSGDAHTDTGKAALELLSGGRPA